LRGGVARHVIDAVRHIRDVAVVARDEAAYALADANCSSEELADAHGVFLGARVTWSSS
jgi:hypothetical protein